MPAFHHTREIQAGAETVFQALADPARLARWWGPDGFTTSTHSFEFAAGGRWDFTMHGPDGASYPNQVVFAEIVPNVSVVLQHLSAPRFRLSISLAPSAQGTVVSWDQEFEDPALAAKLGPIVGPANEQNLARWEQEVGSFPARGR